MVAKRESRTREESPTTDFLSVKREKIQQLCHMLHKGPNLLPNNKRQEAHFYFPPLLFLISFFSRIKPLILDPIIIDNNCKVDIEIKHDLFTTLDHVVAGIQYMLELRPTCPLFYTLDAKYGSLETAADSGLILKGNCDQYRDILLMLGKPGHFNTLAYIPADENHDEIRSAHNPL